MGISKAGLTHEVRRKTAAANAGFYAQIVAEKEILRRLVDAGTRIVQLGYGGNEGDVGGGEVDEIVDRAQAEIYEVTERRTSEDYVHPGRAAAADDGRDRRDRDGRRTGGGTQARNTTDGSGSTETHPESILHQHKQQSGIPIKSSPALPRQPTPEHHIFRSHGGAKRA